MPITSDSKLRSLSVSENCIYIDGKCFDLIMNASGCRSRSQEHFNQLLNSGMHTIITKTCTLHANIGNDEPNFIELNEHISINCLGMPNYGYKYYRDLLPHYITLSKTQYNNNITYIISMDTTNWDDLRVMLLDYDKFVGGLHLVSREFVELNVSCPNIKKNNRNNYARILAYSPEELSTLLDNVIQLNLQYISIGLKLSPYIDKILLEQIAKVLIIRRHIVKYIVCGNSIPNGMIIDAETKKPLLSINTGGVSGTVNKLISVSNVYQFRHIFNASVPVIPIVIIGCGGIENENDVLEYLNAGAHCVQIGSSLYINGIKHCIDIKNKFIDKYNTKVLAKL